MRHAENLGRFDHGAAEQRIALGVVGVIADRRSIEPFPLKICGIIHEVVADARGILPRDDGTETILVVERNGDAANDSLRIASGDLRGSVEYTR